MLSFIWCHDILSFTLEIIYTLDNLNNYHTSGDDQDLDDRIIRQLWEENKELREEVSQLRKSSGDDADEGRMTRRILNNFTQLFGIGMAGKGYLIIWKMLLVQVLCLLFLLHLVCFLITFFIGFSQSENFPSILPKLVSKVLIST